MRLLFGVLPIILLGCNTGTGDGDDGSTTPTACGEADLEPAAECSGLSDCGAGAANSKSTAFCEHCLLRPDTHVCEAGTCRALGDTGNVEARFGIPMEAEGAMSFTVASVHPTMADGSKVTCAKLTTTCGFLDNEAINTTNSTFKQFGGGPARSDSVYPVLISAEAGSDRLLFIQVTTELQGKGDVVAHGCEEGIAVTAGESTQVPLEILPI